MAGTSNGNKNDLQNAGTSDLKLKKIRTIFWDLDNTLISTRLGDSKACRKLSEVLENRFGFTKDEATTATQTFLKSFRRCPDNTQTSLDSWRTYLWREALPNRYKHLAEQIYPKWLELRVKYLALPAEHIKLLQKFRRAGFLLALITNGPSNAQWEKIHKLKVQQYFDCVLVSSDLPWEKPNPHIFHAACNFLGVKPQTCAMIGDKLETDIKGGCLAKLGASFWLPLNQSDIDCDLADVAVAHRPDYVLRSLSDLYKYFPINGVASAVGGMSTIGAATTSAAGGQAQTALNGAANQSNHYRRCSQISRSTTTSTCNSDLQRLQQQQQQHQQKSFPCYQQLVQNEVEDEDEGDVDIDIVDNKQYCVDISQKQRRGGSLPAIESFHSETENSSDSVMMMMG